MQTSIRTEGLHSQFKIRNTLSTTRPGYISRRSTTRSLQPYYQNMFKYLETIVGFLDHQGIDQDIENLLLGAPGERSFFILYFDTHSSNDSKSWNRGHIRLTHGISAHPYSHLIIELRYSMRSFNHWITSLKAFLFTRKKRNMNIRQLESLPGETRRTMFLNLPCPAHP